MGARKGSRVYLDNEPDRQYIVIATLPPLAVVAQHNGRGSLNHPIIISRDRARAHLT